MSAINMGVFVPEENCRIPEGAKVVQLKYCELCGAPFPRAYSPTVPTPITEEVHRPVLGLSSARGHTVWEHVKIKHQLRHDMGQRLCRRCHAHPSLELSAEELLKDQDEYKAQLPALETIHASAHLIHYPPVGRETSAHRQNKMQPRAVRGNNLECKARAARTRLAVVSAFKERGRLGIEELQALIPECYALCHVHVRMQGLKLKPRLVGRVRQAGLPGAGLGIYVLDGVSPETLQ